MTMPGGKQLERRNEGAVRRLTGGALAGAAVLILTAGGCPSANPAAQSHSASAAGAAVGHEGQRPVNLPSESRTMTEASSVTSYGGRMTSSRPPLVLRSSDSLRVSRGSGGRTPARLPGWVRTCQPEASHRATDHPNGQVPSDELCRLPGTSHLLHHDAARSWWRLDRAYARQFGSRLCVTDSYRSYEAQVQVYSAKPGLAAEPGTSNHGWGVAVDLCGGVESYDSEPHRWLQRHGGDFGWVNPPWARANGSLPEPWHWEYVG